MARFLNRRENPNALAGLFLLILLGVFAGPTVLPDLIATTVPFVDEGVPCGRLRDGADRATNQSLIGREVSNNPGDPPISLEVRSEGLSGEAITVAVIVTNETLGTVPIVINSGGLLFANGDARNGFGVVFAQAPVAASGEGVGQYPADRIRLLAPRQRCVYRTSIPIFQLPNSSILVAENATVTAFYRNNSTGTIPFTTGNIYSDQGLWVGTTQSEPALITGG